MNCCSWNNYKYLKRIFCFYLVLEQCPPRSVERWNHRSCSLWNWIEFFPCNVSMKEYNFFFKKGCYWNRKFLKLQRICWNTFLTSVAKYYSPAKSGHKYLAECFHGGSVFFAMERTAFLNWSACSVMLCPFTYFSGQTCDCFRNVEAGKVLCSDT